MRLFPAGPCTLYVAKECNPTYVHLADFSESCCHQKLRQACSADTLQQLARPINPINKHGAFAEQVSMTTEVLAGAELCEQVCQTLGWQCRWSKCWAGNGCCGQCIVVMR